MLAAEDKTRPPVFRGPVFWTEHPGAGLFTKGLNRDVQRKPSAVSGSFRSQSAVIGAFELHRPGTMSSLLTAFSSFFRSMLQIWQQDQIRVPPSEGTLLRLQSGDRIVIRKHVFLVVRRQLKRSSVLLNVCYELTKWHDDRQSVCCLAITFHPESLQVEEIRMTSHRFHPDLGHSDCSHVDLCETGLQSDDILILPHG